MFAGCPGYTQPVSVQAKPLEQLIEYLAAKRFDPNEYHDEFKRRVEAAIQQKIQGREISMAEPPVSEAPGNVIDLMSALKASLEAKDNKPASHERKAPRRAETPARRRAAR